MNTNTLTRLIEIQTEEKTIMDQLADLFLPYFSDEQDNFSEEMFEQYGKYNSEYFTMSEEFPGWTFTGSIQDEAGGRYSYHIIGFSPENDNPRKYLGDADISVEIYWQ